MMILHRRTEKNNKKVDHVELVFHILALVILTSTVLLVLNNLNMITDIGYEDIYWERARFMAGQKGASRYAGISLCSIGYSFVLLPLCLIFKSSYAAYKAAILLNSVFLCTSYFISYRTIRSWFDMEDRRFLSFACLAVALCPVYTVARIYTRPDMIVMFLTWLALYFLTELWNSYSVRKLVGLEICLVLIGFFSIAMIGVIGAVVLVLAFFVKQKKVNQSIYLWFIIVLLVGLSMGNVTERLVLLFFFRGQDTIPKTSFSVLLNCINAGWTNGMFVELFYEVLGKLFAMMIGTLLIMLPGLWFVVKKVLNVLQNGKKNEQKYSALDVMCGAIGVMLIFQILILSLCDNSRSADTGLVSLNNLDVVLYIFVLIGFVEIKNRAVNTRLLMCFLLSLCATAYMTADVFQRKGVTSFSKLYSSVLTIFTNNEMVAVSTVYFATCMTILAFIVFVGCWTINPQKEWIKTSIRCMGGAFIVLLYCCAGLKIYEKTVAVSNEKMPEYVGSVASLISETEGQCYYLKGTGHDNNIVVLQSLIPEHEIKLVEDSAQEREEFYADILDTGEDAILITGVGSSIRAEIQEKLPEFRLLYMTSQYALWADQNSDSCAKLQDGVSRRIETPELKTEEDTVIKYKTAPLSAGTYRLEIYLHRNKTQMKKPAKKTGTLTVSDSKGTIQTLDFSGKSFDEEGNCVLVMEFTGKDVMENVELQLKGTAVSYFDVEKIYYWQLSPEYTIGQNKKAKIAEICSQIKVLDETCGFQGDVTFIENVIKENERISVSCLEEFLPSYEIAVCSGADAESVTSDYLIAATDLHVYFPVMDRYSVIYRDNSYTILVKNDTDQYQKYLYERKILSQGTRLLMSAFEKANSDYTKQIRLERGTYTYHFTVDSDEVKLYGGADAAAGLLSLYNGNTLITQKTILNKDVLQGEIEVPFVLRTTAKKLKYKLELDSAEQLELTQDSVEFVSQKYQYGMEEESIPELAQIVNVLGEHIQLVPIVANSTINEKKNEYTWLEELMPECTVYEETMSDVNASSEDRLLLVYNLTAENLQLLNTYSIIGHFGKYTLMARSDGELLAKAARSGVRIWNSGKKLSPQSISRMSGISSSGDVIGYLPYGKYRVTVQLNLDGLESDDTIELSLQRSKTANEISEEQDDLVSQGYTQKQAKEMVESQMKCGSATLDAYQYVENENSIVSIQTSSARELENLTFEGYTWHGIEVTGKILWIELM